MAEMLGSEQELNRKLSFNKQIILSHLTQQLGQFSTLKIFTNFQKLTLWMNDFRHLASQIYQLN